MEQQKSQRNKAKDKERDNKKKEYRDEAFDGKGKKGKKWLIISVIINIGLLVFFKYLTFICDTLNALFSLNIALKMNIVMPIGISKNLQIK